MGNGLDSWLNPNPQVKRKRKHQSPQRKLQQDATIILSSDEDADGSSKPSKPSEVVCISSGSEEEENPTKSKPKRVLNLATLLGEASNGPSFPSRVQPQGPVRLYTPKQVSENLPCSLVPSPLSESFASALYLALVRESEHEEVVEPATANSPARVMGGFRRHRFYLNGRYVTSPHTSGYYRLPEEAGGAKNGGEYWYAGKREPEPPTFPALLKEAMKKINPYINSILTPPLNACEEWRANARGGLTGPKRYRYEYDGDWRANVAAVNCYKGGDSGVGWHADQLTHLGPYPTIVSLSLGTPRNFRLRPNPHPDDSTRDVFGRKMRTYEVELGHNSLLIMHAGCQEMYKHTVPLLGKNKSLDVFQPRYSISQEPIDKSQREKRTERINVTFRFYRPDFHSLAEAGREGTPICRCGIPSILQCDQKGRVKNNMTSSKTEPVSDDPADTILFFYRCQSTAQTGDAKGCGYFRLFDWQKEGKGPLIGNRHGELAG